VQEPHTASAADISQPFHSDWIADFEAVFICFWTHLDDCPGTFMAANLS
jgi:hypothetical protein